MVYNQEVKDEDVFYTSFFVETCKVTGGYDYGKSSCWSKLGR